MPKIKSKGKKKRDRFLEKAPKERCQKCGHEFPVRELYKGKDPYVSEIWGNAKAEDVVLCQKCYRDIAWDI